MDNQVLRAGKDMMPTFRTAGGQTVNPVRVATV